MYYSSQYYVQTRENRLYDIFENHDRAVLSRLVNCYYFSMREREGELVVR